MSNGKLLHWFRLARNRISNCTTLFWPLKVHRRNKFSENFANSIRTAIEEWGVLGNVTAMITDNAKNMIRSCEILQIIPCFAHSINLTVQDCLVSENMKPPISEKCKRIVSLFNSSTFAYAVFREAKDCNPYGSKQECPSC